MGTKGRPLIIDSNVAIKWVIPSGSEPLEPQALRVGEAIASGTETALVPDLFWPEIGNILAKMVFRHRLSTVLVPQTTRKMQQFDLVVLPTAGLVPRAMELSLGFRQPAYDFFYVALAEAASDILVTADERLVHTLGPKFPVRWLGEF